jgi:hypothetical protein
MLPNYFESEDKCLSGMAFETSKNKVKARVSIFMSWDNIRDTNFELFNKIINQSTGNTQKLCKLSRMIRLN